MKRSNRALSVIIVMLILLSMMTNINVFAYDEIRSLDEIDVSSFNLPIISVVTENGEKIVDRDNYVNCTVAVSNADAEYCLDPTVAGIRYRGNSTYTMSDKKAYRFKFEKKQNLFGMGKAKSWVLLANSFDKTMVKNAIAFAVAKQLGLEYSSGCQFVNVYLNEQYLGLYLLCEQTQTGDNRVEIEEDETGKVDTGYLVEFVGNGDSTEDAYFYMNEVDTSKFASGVTVNWRKNVMKCYLKTPEKQFCSTDQLNFISDYTNRFNEAILTQNWETFNQLCDVSSFAKFFIVNTVMNNGDGGYQLYFYKKQDGGKVYAGPVWDFDQSAGGTTQCSSNYSKWYYGSSNPWFDSFSHWDEFMDLAREYYDQNIDEIKSIISLYTTEFYAANKYDFLVNDIKWNNVTTDYWRITTEISMLKTYEDNFNQLDTWFYNRISWLDANYHSLEKYTYNNNQTCISDGTESAACKDCDYVSTRTVKNTRTPDVHTFTNYVYNNDATCVTDGTTSAKCDYCNATDTKADPEHPATGVHTFGEYIYNNDATRKSDGTKTAVCTICGHQDTVTAVGTKLPPIEILNTATVFNDVNPSAWYKQYVDYAYSYRLFNGMSNDTFEPDTPLTRGMFITLIARIDGVDTSNNDVATKFSDVRSGKYYTAAVKWATDKEIVNGITATTFEPDSKISREQLCTILVRYSLYIDVCLKFDIPAAVFYDDSQIHDYAKSAVYACQMAGIVNGITENGYSFFKPLMTATRAQASKILCVFSTDYLD